MRNSRDALHPCSCYSWNRLLSWWRYQMETFSTLLVICAGNSPILGEFPAQRPVARRRYWPFVQGIHRSPVNSPHKGQWRGALVFSVICVWINGWVNNREASDLRRYRAHYDVIVMCPWMSKVSGNKSRRCKCNSPTSITPYPTNSWPVFHPCLSNRYHAIISTSADLLLSELSGRNFSDNYTLLQ